MGELVRRAWSLDPAVLVDAARLVPLWLACLLVAAGLGYAGFGAHRLLLRTTVGSLAAAFAWFEAAAVVPPATVGLSPALFSWIAACLFGILGAVWPVAAAFACCALVGGRAFARYVPFDEPLLRVLPGGVAGGLLGAFFTRAAAALVSAFVGAALAAVGCAALLLQTGHADWLAPHPVVTLLPFSLVFVAGAAFQLTRKPEPARARRRRAAPEAGLSGGST